MRKSPMYVLSLRTYIGIGRSLVGIISDRASSSSGGIICKVKYTGTYNIHMLGTLCKSRSNHSPPIVRTTVPPRQHDRSSEGYSPGTAHGHREVKGQRSWECISDYYPYHTVVMRKQKYIWYIKTNLYGTGWWNSILGLHKQCILCQKGVCYDGRVW